MSRGGSRAATLPKYPKYSESTDPLAPAAAVLFSARLRRGKLPRAVAQRHRRILRLERDVGKHLEIRRADVECRLATELRSGSDGSAVGRHYTKGGVGQ